MKFNIKISFDPIPLMKFGFSIINLALENEIENKSEKGLINLKFINRYALSQLRDKLKLVTLVFCHIYIGS
jgi:hypothetical protein